MGYFRATFLCKEYSIPDDVLVYIDLLDFTENIKNQLFNAFVRKLKAEIAKDNIGLLGDEDLALEIEQQVGRFISKLCDNGIFTRTISDYLKNNKGYQLYSQVNKATLEKMKSLLIQKMDAWQAGYENAVNKAESHVTGMGFSIWSSSFVNHAIYAALEASTLNKQGKEAEAQYHKDMNDLRSRLDSQYGGEKSKYINNTYIPNMEAALTVFAYELLDKYVADLIANGKFDAKTLDYIDISRSNDLLKNLTFSNNKKVILENAFAACPYNIAVYMQAMKYELLDYDSYQTAKVFKQHNLILSFLRESWGDISFPTKFDINYYCIKIWASFTNKQYADLLHELTAQYATGIIKAYSRIGEMLTNKQLCLKVMKSCSEDSVLAGDAICKVKAHSYVDTIVPATIWSQLTEKCGHTDLLDRIKAQFPGFESAITKRDVDMLLEERLYPMLEEARQVYKTEIIKKREDEAKKKAAEEESARRTAKRNKKIKIICLIAVVVAIIIAIISSLITKANNAKAYQEMAGEFCVYRVINDEGEEREEFNWWLSIGEDGTMQMSSWSYALDDTTVDSYSGALKNRADFRKFEDYRIEDYCADISEYEEALYCYEFHIADEWDEFDGYIVCWRYHNGKIIDVYCDDYRYSFVETSDDYSFNKWEGEINSDKLSKNVQNLVDNIDVSEEDVIKEIENLISSGSYDKAVEAIVASKLSDEQKNTYYDSLVKKIDFKTFDVNGLAFHIPEHWHIRDYDDPNISEASYPEEGSRVFWYVKYMGTAAQISTEGDDYWKTRDDFSNSSISGCTNAYVRFDSGYDNEDEQYFVIEHFVECDGQIYQVQFLAYGGRYYEPEFWALLERVEFTNYAENRVDIQEQKYLDAIELFNEGKYEEALSIFATLEGYKESAKKIAECNNAITDGKYNSAIALINEGQYKDAIVLLGEVGDYKDAVNLKQKYALLACEAGDVITFGAYEQDNNRDNGAEAIEWVVLERDGNKALVISQYCIEWLPFHNTFTEIGWKNSSIRSWLNNTFLNEAFTAQEKKSILSTQHTNPDFYDDSEGERNWLGTTTDTVFLLSSGEADKYFSSDSARQAEGTEYACNKGKSASWYWWLRSANNIEYAGFVSEGELGYGEEVDRNMGIRPAMWIEIGN